MKVLFDTNVILDVLLDRDEFSEPAIKLMAKVEEADIDGLICGTTVTTIYYLVAKALGHEAARRHISSLISLFEIAPVNRMVLEDALTDKFNDFEDAVLHEAAIHSGAEYIITRNIADFKNSKIPVFEPTEFLKIIESLK